MFQTIKKIISDLFYTATTPFISLPDKDKLEQKIESSLASLGNNANEIANALVYHGIKGQKENGYSCPLANFITPMVPEVPGYKRVIDIGMDNWAFGYIDGKTMQTASFVRHRLSNGAKEFITLFDQNVYPGLINRNNDEF